jgi:hypothetical protein
MPRLTPISFLLAVVFALHVPAASALTITQTQSETNFALSNDLPLIGDQFFYTPFDVPGTTLNLIRFDLTFSTRVSYTDVNQSLTPVLYQGSFRLLTVLVLGPIESDFESSYFYDRISLPPTLIQPNGSVSFDYTFTLSQWFAVGPGNRRFYDSNPSVVYYQELETPGGSTSIRTDSTIAVTFDYTHGVTVPDGATSIGLIALPLAGLLWWGRAKM